MSNELPNGWAVARLTDLAVKITDGTHQPPKFVDAGIPFVVIGNLRGDSVDWASIKKWVSAETFAQESRRISPQIGDVLYSAVGSYGIVVQVKDNRPFMFQRHIAYIRPEMEIVNSTYLTRALASPICKEQADAAARGVAQRTVTLGDLGKFELPIAPLPEQHRIVAKIDSLFARSSRARDELAHIPKLIERYRQAVLEAAFRGDLTADWRASQPVNDTGQHFDAVLAERRARWQAAQPLARRKTYPQPEEADFFPEINLPEGWTWASVDQLTTQMQYGTSAKTNEDATGIPVLRMGNIVRGELQVDNLKYLPADHDEFPALLLHDGDILFNRTNSPELVGKTAVFKGQLPRASFASYLIRLKAVGILPSLLSAYINSPYGRSWVASVVSQQVGQANVNGTKLSRLAVPLIPDEEQVILDQRINTSMTAIDAMEREMLRAAGMIDRLDQSILDKAFTGKLVPQDPTDEPASKLLERIQAARAATPKAKRGRRKAAP